MAGLYRFSAFLTSLLLVAGTVTPTTPAPTSQRKDSFAMNRAAESYVKLVLAVGQHDADYVDAFYGPPEWKAESEHHKRPVREIDAGAARLIDQIPAVAASERHDELAVLRREYLRRQLEALRARLRMLEGAK